MKVFQTRPFGPALLLVSAALFMAQGTLRAQSIYGSIRGDVTDSTGAAVANAKITLISEGTSEQRAAFRRPFFVAVLP